MGQLALKGHQKQGGKVIEILEMLGGNNANNCYGDYHAWAYYINENGYIDRDFIAHIEQNTNFIIYTLEEFEEKFPYKVGDKVSVPEYESKVCIEGMKWDGSEIQYLVFTDETEWYSAKELNEYNEPYKEETIEESIDKTNKIIFETNSQSCEIMNNIIKEETMGERKYSDLRLPLDDDDKLATEVTIGGNKIFPPNGYLIGKITQVDNGMLVEYVKKQPQYPKTYKECFNICFGNRHHIVQVVGLAGLGDNKELFESFIKLKICRDAYWKIAGEQMGLSKPWEPAMQDTIWGITRSKDEIEKYSCHYGKTNLLVFPTEEMRNTFYENFKDLIEQCKELL